MSSSTAFLELPASYDIKVDDVIFCRNDGLQEDAQNSKESSATSTATTGPGVLLMAKICDALLNQGPYNDGEILRKVGGLVTKNLMTCFSGQPGVDVKEFSHNFEPRIVVDSMLRLLLDKETSRSRTVQVNSNEPVLLINQPSGLLSTVFRGMVDDTIEQLQQQWNIWPVRTYAGQFLPISENEGFSVTLLNVVNTDIGGPSMIQLLDSACEAPEWNLKHGYMRREIWRDRELVGREEWSQPCSEEEEDGVDSDIDDDASEESLESEADSVASEPGLATTTHIETTASVLPQTAPKIDQQPQTSSPQDLTVETEKEPVHSDQEALEEEGQPEETTLPLRSLVHPTWERPYDQMSLLDLIRSQASSIAPFGQEIEADHTAEETKDDPPAGKAGSSSDGDFVVV